MSELLPLILGVAVAFGGMLLMLWRCHELDKRIGPHYCAWKNRYCDKLPTECQRNRHCEYNY